MKERTNDGLLLKQVAVFLILFLSLNLAYAQKGEALTVRGTISSAEDNKPLSGVTVLEKGTGKGTTSDAAGNYSLMVTNNSVLVFQHVGFASKEMPVAGQTNFDISLELDRQQLKDVVVVGYGNQRKRNITGAITNISAKDHLPGPASS